MILNEINSRQQYVLSVAQAMMAAARTAPKAKGADSLYIVAVTGDDLVTLANQMRDYSQRSGFKFFMRDAENTEQSEAVVLIGTYVETRGLNCGYCGSPTCAAKIQQNPLIPCSFNTVDLGIAASSAATVAADKRIDNRIMYTQGIAALELGWLPGCTNALGISLSCTAKSPFFDRVFQK